MQRKIHNKTLFVAALSVYLGLLIAGAPPQVLAQHQIINSQQIKTASSFDCRDYTVAEIVRVFAEQGNNLNNIKPTFYSRKSNYRDGQRIDSQLLNADGENFIVDFFNSLERCGKSEYPKISSILFSFTANEKEIVFDASAVFPDALTADDYAQTNQDLYKHLNNKRKTESPNLTQKVRLEILTFDNTNIRSENDQVFIVTRLPRAALDSLIKADEKAN